MIIRMAGRCWITRCPPPRAYLGRLAPILPLNPLRAEGVFWRHRVILLSRLILGSHLRSPVYTPTLTARLPHYYSFHLLHSCGSCLRYAARAPTTALSGCSP